MRRGTRWHATRLIVPIYRASTEDPNYYNKGMDRVPVRANARPSPQDQRSRPSGLEVRMTCPKCGEARLIERVDGHRWFCALCAHSWTVAATSESGRTHTA